MLAKLRFQGVLGASAALDFARLPQAQRQLRAISRRYAGGTEIHPGAAASEARLRDPDLSNYHPIAFATHGLLDGVQITEPALLLSPGAGSAQMIGEGYSGGLLTVSEIALLSIDADLVVLSACNAAKASSAEGLNRLTQAFMFAGARSVLATHWSIDANATADLLEYAFAESDHDERKVAGLIRTAKRRMLREDRNAFRVHPLFWGGLVIYGAPGGD